MRLRLVEIEGLSEKNPTEESQSHTGRTAEAQAAVDAEDVEPAFADEFAEELVMAVEISTGTCGWVAGWAGCLVLAVNCSGHVGAAGFWLPDCFGLCVLKCLYFAALLPL